MKKRAIGESANSARILNDISAQQEQHRLSYTFRNVSESLLTPNVCTNLNESSVLVQYSGSESSASNSLPDNFLAMKSPTEFPLLERLGAGSVLPLRWLKSSKQLVYVSAIAHKLAAQRSPLFPNCAKHLAQQLVIELTQWIHQDSPDRRFLPLPLPALALRELTIYTAGLNGSSPDRPAMTGDGLVYFEISDRALALWLNGLLSPVAAPEEINAEDINAIEDRDSGAPQNFAGPSPTQIPPTEAATLFRIHHAHARCCSLLRIAHGLGVLTLEPLQEHPNHWQISKPSTIPWLTPTGELMLNHPSERQGIYTIFRAAVELHREPPLSRRAALAIAEDIALAFAQFHRDRPLFAPPASESRRWAQWGFVLATQRLLYQWLTVLESTAPTRL